MKKNIRIVLKSIFLAVFLIFVINLAIASTPTVCCQKTISGLYCQNVPKEECAADSKQMPTSCSSTSFCKQGVCYNPIQGTCAENTPEIVCSNNGGKWFSSRPAQCELGCCTLGDQAAFVTLVRCKYLASTLGLQTNYNKAIKSETECVLSVQNQDKGACVYDFEFERTCKFTTRQECLAGVNNTGEKGEFFKGKLCTAPELGTKCSMTSNTICLPGKEEVYFVDNCGNPANIYDARYTPEKLNNNPNTTDYWKEVKTKEQSCNPNSDNANSASCGNCNYILGSVCRAATSKNRPSYGTNICANLNCPAISKGAKLHGESWCVYNDKGNQRKGNNAVGSRFYKHICINGEEVVEQCADFREYECIEDSIQMADGKKFSQAACRVNRWQDCTSQTEKSDCENSDKRDCIWKAGYKPGNSSDGICVPKNPPGLRFWEDEAKTQCSKANEVCAVKFEKGIFGSGSGEAVENKECITSNWLSQRKEICSSMGDCGTNINWLGQDGWKSGWDCKIDGKNCTF
jgi:hypothetical protein